MKKVQLGNSRLLFEKQSKNELDIFKAISKIDHFLSESSKLYLAEEKIYLLSEAEAYLIGREIIGPCDFLPAGLQAREYYSREVEEEVAPREFKNYEELLAWAESFKKADFRLVFSENQFLSPKIQLEL